MMKEEKKLNEGKGLKDERKKRLNDEEGKRKGSKKKKKIKR